MFGERFGKLADSFRKKRDRSDIADVLESPSTKSSSLSDATEKSHHDMLLETNTVRALPYFVGQVQNMAREYVGLRGLDEHYVDHFTQYFTQAAQQAPRFLDFLQNQATPDQYQVLRSVIREGPGYVLNEGAKQLQGVEGIEFGSSNLSRLVAAELALRVEGLEAPEQFDETVASVRENFYELPLVALYGHKTFEPIRMRSFKNNPALLGSDWMGLYHRANQRLKQAVSLPSGPLRLVTSDDDSDSSSLSSPDSLDLEPLTA